MKEILIMNVSDIIKRALAEDPEKTAIIFGDRRISYSQLSSLVDRTADGLLKMGLNRGDVLSLFLPSLPELIIGYLGTVRAGLTVNVVNAMLKEQEVAYILKDCSTRAVLVDDKRLSIVEAIRSEVESLREVIVLGKTSGDDQISYDSMLGKEDVKFQPSDTKGSDICHLMYTSGTTGWPKGLWPPTSTFGIIPLNLGRYTSVQWILSWWPLPSFIAGDSSTEPLGCSQEEER